MDFFEAQDQARQKSHWLVLYFLAAVTCIILAIYIVVSFIFFGTGEQESVGFSWFSPLRLVVVAGGTLLVIGLASFFKIVQLQQGGGVVARSVGGKKVHPETQDFQEQQLLNVIEEMTIASGAPMPEVYILENENGINAFAAGFSPNDAAIAVTRGTLDQLSRDELQGVIAHEFSHILNGDMRLNIKLGGILFGILVLAITGRIIMYALRFSGGRSSRGSGKGGGGGLVLAIFLTGVALFIIGYIGIFFGRLIQAAVSRQREYLADAAAVQFTRNPDGISGALKKIGGFSQSSALENGKAMNIAHMCFGRIGKSEPMFFSLATHPPLVKRIQAIDPSFEGSFPKVQAATPEKKQKRKASGPQVSAFGQESEGQPPPLPPQSSTVESRFQVGKTKLSQSVGSLAPEQISRAREQINQIPRSIQLAKQDSGAARAVILALVFDRDPSSLLKQMNAVRQGAAPETADALQRLSIDVRKLPKALRLPVLEMMIPVLYQLPPFEYETFLEVLQQCVGSDRKTDFWEFVLLRLVRRQVEPRIYKKSVDQADIRHKSIRSIQPYAATLFNFLVRQSHADTSSQKELFESIRQQETEWSDMPWTDDRELNIENLGRALDELSHASFPLRKKILEISHESISQDETITIGEAEGLRLLSISLDCPLGALQPAD